MVELWLVLAIVSTFLYAVTNMIDKPLVSKYVKSIPAMIGVSGLINALVVIVLHALGYSIQLTLYGALAIFSGIWIGTSIFVFLRALKSAEVSRVIPVVLTTPLAILVLAAIFLGEIFTPSKYIGITILLIGSALIALRREQGRIVHMEGLKFALPVIFAWASNAILVKWLFRTLSYPEFLVHVTLGFFLASLVVWIHAPWRRKFVQTLQTRVVWIIATAGSTVLAADFLGLYAISLGPVSLVTAIHATQSVFVLLLASVVSWLRPDILKEELNRKTIAVKLIAISFIVLGVYLIS